MTDSPVCPVCEQLIHLDESVYSWLDHQPMEHLACHVRWLDASAKAEASANPAYGPMS
jgi:hypothetical protein